MAKGKEVAGEVDESRKAALVDKYQEALKDVEDAKDLTENTIWKDVFSKRHSEAQAAGKQLKALVSKGDLSEDETLDEIKKKAKQATERNVELRAWIFPVKEKVRILNELVRKEKAGLFKEDIKKNATFDEKTGVIEIVKV